MNVYVIIPHQSFSRKERRLELIKDDRGPDSRGAGGGRSKIIDLNAPIGPVDGEVSELGM